MYPIDSKSRLACFVLAFTALMISPYVVAQDEEPSETCQKIMSTPPWSRAQLKEDLSNDYGQATAEAMMAWSEATGSLQTAYSKRVSDVEAEQRAYTDGVSQCIEELMPTCDETLASFEETGVPEDYTEQVDDQRSKAQQCIFDIEKSVKGE